MDFSYDFGFQHPDDASGRWEPTNPASWWLADTDVTGDPVDSWGDQGSLGATLAQTASDRPSKSTALGVDSVLFDGATDHMDASKALGTYKALHDGTGGGVIAVFRPSAAAQQCVVSAARPLTTQDGATLAWEDGTDAVRLWIVNSTTGSYAVNDITASNSAPVDNIVVAGFRLTGTAYEVRANDTSKSGTSGTLPSVNESSVLRLGEAAGAGAFNLNGHILEVIIYLSTISDDEWNGAFAGLQALYS